MLAYAVWEGHLCGFKELQVVGKDRDGKSKQRREAGSRNVIYIWVYIRVFQVVEEYIFNGPGWFAITYSKQINGQNDYICRLCCT